MSEVPNKQPEMASRVQIGDVVAFVASVAILVGYAAFPLRSDGATTGLGFIDSATTFPSLTMVVGLVGLISSLVAVMTLRDRAVRWWFVGLGGLGMVYLLDNTLRQKATLSSGGTIAMIGCVALVGQSALPRFGKTVGTSGSEVGLGLVRVVLGAMWFTQLLWKLPWNNFGCEAGPLVPAAGSSGLCDWIGREIASPRWPVYRTFLESIVAPNLSWLAIVIVTGEAFVAFSLLFGLFTRIGALAGTLMGINLFIGLTAVPAEWDWTYLMLIALNAIFIIAGGRFVGLDAVLHSRFKHIAVAGNLPGRLLTHLVS